MIKIWGKQKMKPCWILLVVCTKFVIDIFLLFNLSISLYLSFVSNILFIAIYIMLVFSLSTYRNTMAQSNKVPIVLLDAMIFIIYVMFINIIENDSMFAALLYPSLWFSIMWLAYVYAVNNNVNFINLGFTVVVTNIIIGIVYLTQVINIEFDINKQAMRINSVFYILMGLPFILMLKKKRIRVVLVVLVLIVTMFSYKRTAIVIFFIESFIYFSLVMKSRISRKAFVKMIFVSALIIVSIIYSYDYIVQFTGQDILLKLSDMKADRGSGRIDIYIRVVDALKDSSIFNIVFGHGYGGVARELGGMSSHNDFLEIFFNYGLVGFYLFMRWLCRMFAYVKKMRREHFRYVNIYIVSLIGFCIMICLTHLVFIPSYFYYLTFLWGVFLGNFKRSITGRKLY